MDAAFASERSVNQPRNPPAPFKATGMSDVGLRQNSQHLGSHATCSINPKHRGLKLEHSHNSPERTGNGLSPQVVAIRFGGALGKAHESNVGIVPEITMRYKLRRGYRHRPPLEPFNVMWLGSVAPALRRPLIPSLTDLNSQSLSKVCLLFDEVIM